MNQDQSNEIIEQNQLLKALSELKEFREWRDSYIKPVLKELKIARGQCLTLDETNLKAILLYENKIETLFYTMFEDL